MWPKTPGRVSPLPVTLSPRDGLRFQTVVIPFFHPENLSCQIERSCNLLLVISYFLVLLFTDSSAVSYHEQIHFPDFREGLYPDVSRELRGKRVP